MCVLTADGGLVVTPKSHCRANHKSVKIRRGAQKCQELSHSKLQRRDSGEPSTVEENTSLKRGVPRVATEQTIIQCNAQ